MTVNMRPPDSLLQGNIFLLKIGVVKLSYGEKGSI